MRYCHESCCCCGEGASFDMSGCGLTVFCARSARRVCILDSLARCSFFGFIFRSVITPVLWLSGVPF